MLNAAPANAVHDEFNRRRGHSKSTRKLPNGYATRVSSSDQPHGLSSEFGHGIALTMCGPTFLRHVTLIDERRAEKQVGRPDAEPIVAMVQHPELTKDLTECHSPRDTVGVVVAIVGAAQTKLPVPARPAACCPDPASAQSSTHNRAAPVDLRPKALLERGSHSLACATDHLMFTVIEREVLRCERLGQAASSAGAAAHATNGVT